MISLATGGLIIVFLYNVDGSAVLYHDWNEVNSKIMM